MKSLTILSILLQVNIPTPENYATWFVGLVWGAITGLALYLGNRSITKADEEIKSLKEALESQRKDFLQSLKDVSNDVSKLKESASNNTANLNERFSDFALQITKDLGELSNKLASAINFNDRHPK
jgi:uncharacterized membrane-anchored protein YhcB (DUF1043 family)